MAHDIHAQLRFTSMSAQKVRLVVDLVRGKKAVDAMNTLRFLPNVAARHVARYWTLPLPMLKRTLASAAMICLSTGSSQMKPQLANGADLVPADVSNRFCAAIRISRSSCGKKSNS